MRELRLYRDKKIADTDFIESASARVRVGEEQAVLLDAYRNSLFDLPSTATPTLDDNGRLDLTSFTWPTKP